MALGNLFLRCSGHHHFASQNLTITGGKHQIIASAKCAAYKYTPLPRSRPSTLLTIVQIKNSVPKLTNASPISSCQITECSRQATEVIPLSTRRPTRTTTAFLPEGQNSASHNRQLNHQGLQICTRNPPGSPLGKSGMPQFHTNALRSRDGDVTLETTTARFFCTMMCSLCDFDLIGVL